MYFFSVCVWVFTRETGRQTETENINLGRNTGLEVMGGTGGEKNTIKLNCVKFFSNKRFFKICIHLVL